MKKFIYSLMFCFISFKSVWAFDISDLKGYNEIAVKEFAMSDSLYRTNKSTNTEIAGMNGLQVVLGDEKVYYKTTYVYIGDSKIEEEGETTWYFSSPASWNGRKKYALYYRKNEVMQKAYGGDTLVIAKKDKGEIVLLIVKQKSKAEEELFKVLGMEREKKPSFFGSIANIFKSEEEEEIEEEIVPADIQVLKDGNSQKLVVVGNVSKFQDGDSFILGELFKVRMLAIDTPEKKQICKDKKGLEFKCGEASTEHLKKLIGKGSLSCEMNGWGAYNRHLFVCKNSKGEDINQAMVRDGFAVMSTYKPFLYEKEEAEAKANKRGLWAGEFQHPSDYRKELREKKK